MNFGIEKLFFIAALTLALAVFLAAQDVVWEPEFSEVGPYGRWSEDARDQSIPNKAR